MAQANRDQLTWIDGDMPFSQTFGDHFYARQDGRAETAHVFVGQNRLAGRWQAGGDFLVAELGFGTGLNLFETWRQWIALRGPKQSLRFVSFEAYPMAADDMATAIARWPDIVALCDAFLPGWRALDATSGSIPLDAQTTFEVHIGEAAETVAAWQGQADAWYLDGFAPAKNPAMWSADLMAAVAAHTVPGGTFATYTAAGWVRRNLAAAGFEVEKIAGHGTKREMMRGQIGMASPNDGEG